MNKKVQTALEKIEYCIKNNTYEPIETEIIELKPSLPNEKGKEAKSIYQSINAFLNTKGGILIVGLEEPQETNPQKYVLCGYKEKYENPLKAVEKKFTDSRQQVVDIANCIQYEIIDFMGKSLCILYVNELPEETKFVYFNGEARERKITGDSLITESNIAKHEEYKTELKDRRELLPVETATLQDLSIDLVNDYIYEISRKTHLHNPKSDIYAALPFLIQKMFVLKNTEQVSVLGMLVCGQQPDVFLQQRSHVRAFLKTKIHAADDKAEISGNILDLMRHSLAFVLKSIQIAITRDESGKAIAEYPEDLLSECINNALAHRDYKIDDYVRIVIRPDEHIEITNPGHFKEQLILQELDTVIPFRRIIPASKPTNPNLAQVLSVFSKWEGLGNGMAGLVNAALMNKIDLPYYKFNTIDSLSLFINKGKLLDDEMLLMFEIYDGYIRQKLQGTPFTNEMKETFAYLYKSQLRNQAGYYTILLTSDNNHEQAIIQLLKAQLIYRHPQSPKYNDVFMVDEVFVNTMYGQEMLSFFGDAYHQLPSDNQSLLQIIYQYNRFNQNKQITASKAGNILWFRKNKFIHLPKQYETLKRKVRTQFNWLEKNKFIIRHGEKVQTNYYTLNFAYLKEKLF